MPVRMVDGNAAATKHNLAFLYAALQLRAESWHAPEDRRNGFAAALRALLGRILQRKTPEDGPSANRRFMLGDSHVALTKGI